ncbi:MAG: hypothetical protein ACREDT_12990 [Methylocella sp.]
MDGRRSWLRGVWSALAVVFASVGAGVAEGDQAIATIDKPAAVTAAPAVEGIEPAQAQRVIIKVTGFQPPTEGAVQVVVKARVDDSGAEREIGRFGIFPNAEFKAAEPSKAQRFGLALPKELARGGPVKLNVYLVPLRGEGKGARLELGSAEIR